MNTRFLSILVLFGLTFFPAAPVVAESADEIIGRMEATQAYDTNKSESTMLIYPDARNTKDFREMKMRTYARGDEDSYMVFIAPRSLKGLSILSKGEDQWIYFPSTGRVRKIAAKSKDQSVQGVGGDFSYEDFGGGDLRKKYDFTLTSSETDSWTLTGAPTKDDSVYSKIIITVDKDTYLPKKIEYYTEEDGHLKDLMFDEVKRIGGRDTPTRIAMVNLKKRSMTMIVTHSAEYDVSIDDKYFNPTRFYK